MLSHITGRTRHEEASSSTTTFNLLWWIRARRKKWLGHILRLQPDKRTGEERLIKQTVQHIHEFRSEGDLLMDIDDKLTWEDLQKIAEDRDAWRNDVAKMRAKARGKKWVDSNTRVKQSRQNAKAPTPATTEKSIYRYHLKYQAAAGDSPPHQPE